MTRSVSILFAMMVCLSASYATQLGVNVTNFSFTPGTVTVATGDTIVWTRTLGTHNVHHNVVTPKFHNAIGGTWTTYVWPCSVNVSVLDYLCQFHGAAMSGIVNVAAMNVNAPNGGESWPVGSNQNITWTSPNLAGSANVAIELNRNFPAGAWETVIASTPCDGSHSWVVTGPNTATARIRIRAIQTAAISGSIQDASDGDFQISAASIAVTAPNGGEDWPLGSSQSITWNSSGVGGNVTVEWNLDFPAGTWVLLASNTANDGELTVNPLCAEASVAARVRVTSDDNPAVNDMSDANFTISGTLSEPAQLVIGSGVGAVSLHWLPVVCASEYNIYRRLDLGVPEPIDLIATVSDTVYADSPASLTRAFYTITAVIP